VRELVFGAQRRRAMVGIGGIVLGDVVGGGHVRGDRRGMWSRPQASRHGGALVASVRPRDRRTGGAQPGAMSSGNAAPGARGAAGSADTMRVPSSRRTRPDASSNPSTAARAGMLDCAPAAVQASAEAALAS